MSSNPPERERDTIFAVSSGAGRSGVAVIRVSGPGARRVLERMAGGLPEPRRAVLAALVDPGTGEAIDRGLALWFPGPASFSGEDMAELHVHGGRAVIQAAVDVLARLDGLRPAAAGEFTRRAFDNGKLDLTAVEGLADLINAETEAQRRQALRQSGGALERLYEDWRERLVGALALVEAALDFSDEADVPAEIEARARPAVRALRAAIEAHLADGARGERLRDGLRVVLAGPPNAGKSSLLNLLARRDVAIVSEEAGTTRDVIEVHLDLAGYPVTVMDTAGIREASGAVEAEGVRRAFERAGEADVLLWLIDATAPVRQLPADLVGRAGTVLAVLNKADLAVPEGGQDHIVSAKTGEGLEALVDGLGRVAAEEMTVGEAPQITRARHRLELEAAAAALARFEAGSLDALELRAEDLRAAAHALGRLTGRVDVEDILDRVFADFCIGK